MRIFINIFIFLQVFVLQFIFMTSVYNIYEKNNIINNGDTAFYIKNPSTDELNNLFNLLIEKNIGFEQLRSEPDIKNKTNYNVFYSKESTIKKKNAINSDIKINYQLLQKEDFIDSTGVFYIAKDQQYIIEELNSMYHLNIKAYEENKISYKNILVINGINIYFLLIFSLLTYFMYISSDLKKIAIKKLLGFSTWKIIWGYYRSLLKILGIVIVTLDVLSIGYVAINNSLTTQFIFILAIYSLGIVIVNILLMLMALFLIRFIKMNEMIKQRNFNKVFNKILITFKWVSCVLVAISLVYFSNSLMALIKENNDIENYQKYNNYYTSNGFASEQYDQLLKNKKELRFFSKNIKGLVENENSFFFDYSLVDYAEGEIPPFVISNNKFIEELTQLKNLQGESVELTNVKNRLTILIPQKFQKDEKKIKAYLIKYIVDGFANYDQNYKISEKQQKPTVTIQYITNNQSIHFLGEEKFETIKNPIVVVDNMSFSGMFYADQLNAGNIYFKFDTREDFRKIILKYNLEKEVVLGTLLTPYLTRLENEGFIFQNIIIFIMIFSFIFMFLIYASNQMTILVNRKKYAVQTLLGFSTSKVLRRHIGVLVSVLLLFLVASFYNGFLSLFTLVVLMDFFVLLLMYKKFVQNNLANSIKGE